MVRCYGPRSSSADASVGRSPGAFLSHHESGLEGTFRPKRPPVGGTLSEPSDESSDSLAYLDDLREHGKTLQSQVLTSGKVERYADIFRSCSIKVRVTDVPATGKKYRVKVGKSTSALVSPSKEIKGFGFNVNP